MVTWRYKGCWIHDNFTNGEVTVQLPDYQLVKVKSVHAGKCRITRQQRVKIRKNSLAENLYLDRQGCWVPWKQAAWFGSERAAEQFARNHGIDVFGLFPC